jgi:hypothetical protein
MIALTLILSLICYARVDSYKRSCLIEFTPSCGAVIATIVASELNLLRKETRLLQL